MNENYDYKRLTPFKWFVLQNFPFIDEDFDAITNYQLFCKLGEEINKIINSQNLVGEQVEELTNAFNNLKDYVDKGMLTNTDKLKSDVTDELRWNDFRTSLLGFPVMAFQKRANGSYLFIGFFYLHINVLQ